MALSKTACLRNRYHSKIPADLSEVKISTVELTVRALSTTPKETMRINCKEPHEQN